VNDVLYVGTRRDVNARAQMDEVHKGGHLNRFSAAAGSFDRFKLMLLFERNFRNRIRNTSPECQSVKVRIVFSKVKIIIELPNNNII